VTDRRTPYPSTLARVRDALDRRFGVDPRALAALRISLAALLLLDLALRARDLATFYSDVGVFPRSALAHHYPAMGSVSIHAISGAVWVQALLFLVAAAFATAFFVGYRTRLATLASLVLLVSCTPAIRWSSTLATCCSAGCCSGDSSSPRSPVGARRRHRWNRRQQT